MEQGPVFPPEVLERILGELPPTKFLEVINEHLGLSELPHMKKKTKLFPLVLPFLFDYLPMNEVLAYRTLSHVMKNSVDSILQENSLEPSSMFKRSRVSKRMGRVQKLDELHSLTVNRLDWTPFYVQRCLTHFSFTSSPNCNPFLMGTAKLLLHSRYQASLMELLSHFGHKLLSIECGAQFVIRNRATTTMEPYFSPPNYLISVLHLTPNIKSLAINGTLNLTLDNDPWSPQRLPALPHLEKLTLYTVFRSGSGGPEPSFFRYVAPFFQRYGAQLTSFVCAGSLLNSTFLTRKGLRNCMPNLRRLSIHPEDQLGLNKLKYVSWKLEHLQIFNRGEDVDDLEDIFDDTFPTFPIHHLLGILSNFAGTLKELNLRIRLKNGGGGGDDVVFSRLKKLTMQLEIYKLKQICEVWLRKFIIGSCVFVEELNFELLTSVRIGPEEDDFLENPFVVIMSKAYFASISKLELIIWLDIRADKKWVVRRGMLGQLG